MSDLVLLYKGGTHEILVNEEDVKKRLLAGYTESPVLGGSKTEKAASSQDYSSKKSTSKPKKAEPPPEPKASPTPEGSSTASDLESLI